MAKSKRFKISTNVSILDLSSFLQKQANNLSNKNAFI